MHLEERPKGLRLSMGQGSPTSTHARAKRQYRAELGATDWGEGVISGAPVAQQINP